MTSSFQPPDPVASANLDRVTPSELEMLVLSPSALDYAEHR